MPSKGKRKAEDNTPASTTTRLTKRQKAMKDNIEKEKAKKEEAKREEAKKAEAKKIDVKKAEASSSKVPRKSVPKKNVTKEKATSNNLEGKKAEASSSKATRKSKAKRKAAPSVGGETTEPESELEDQTPAKEDSGDDGHSETTAVAESACADDEAKDKAPTLSTENEEDLSLVQLLPPLTAIARTPNKGKGIASSEVQSEVATPKSEFLAESDVSDDDDEEDGLAFEEAVELKAPTWETLEATQGTSAQPTIVPETPSGYLKTDRRAKLFGAIGGVGKFTYTQRTPRDKTLRCTPRSARKSKPDSLLNGSPSRRA